MLTQEEIRIKAGLDYSKVTAGLTDIRAQVFKLAKDVPNKLTSLLKANIYGAAASIITEILPSWKEIWDGIYNTGEDAVKRAAESNSNIRSIRAAAVSAAKELQDTLDKIAFKNSKSGEKLFLLEQKRRDNLKEQEKISKRIAFEQEINKGMAPMSDSTGEIKMAMEDRAKLIGNLQTALSGLKKEAALTTDEMNMIAKKMPNGSTLAIGQVLDGLNPRDKVGVLEDLKRLDIQQIYNARGRMQKARTLPEQLKIRNEIDSLTQSRLEKESLINSLKETTLNVNIKSVE